MTRKSPGRGKATIPESPHINRRGKSWIGKSLPRESSVTLLEAADILPMCLQGADGSVLGVNHAWLRLARREGGLAGMRRRQAAKAADHPPVPLEVGDRPRPAPDGKWRQGSCIGGDGRPVHVLTAGAILTGGMQVVLAVDITRLKAARERSRRNQHVGDDVHRTGYLLTLEYLSSWLIHEISQPLMATVATAQAARRLVRRPQPDLREIERSIEDVIAYQRRAGKIIQRLRAVLPKSEPKRARLDVSELILEVVRFLTDRGDFRGTRVRLSLARNPLLVKGARVQLRQVFLNLILSAMEAMQTTPAQQRRLWISAVAESEPATIHIVVRDTGEQPRKADFIQFFGERVRGHSDVTALGLAVAQAIVVDHSGRIWIRRGRQGAELHVILPIASGRSM